MKCKNNSCIFQLKKGYKKCYYCGKVVIEKQKEDYKTIKEVLNIKYIV